MKKIIIFFISILISLSSNAYSFEKKAESFILKTTSDAKKIILDTKINEKEKRKKLEELTLSSVDVVGLAKYTLGEEVKKLNDKQLSLYVDTFKIFLDTELDDLCLSIDKIDLRKEYNKDIELIQEDSISYIYNLLLY